MLTLPALALMDTPESRQFLENAKRLFAGLEDAYVADPRTPILVSSLAASSGVTEIEARSSLSYLAKVTPWLAIPPQDVLNNMDAKVATTTVARHGATEATLPMAKQTSDVPLQAGDLGRNEPLP